MKILIVLAALCAVMIAASFARACDGYAPQPVAVAFAQAPVYASYAAPVALAEVDYAPEVVVQSPLFLSRRAVVVHDRAVVVRGHRSGHRR